MFELGLFTNTIDSVSLILAAKVRCHMWVTLQHITQGVLASKFPISILPRVNIGVKKLEKFQKNMYQSQGPILYLVFVIVIVIMHISNVYLLVLSKATG